MFNIKTANTEICINGSTVYVLTLYMGESRGLGHIRTQYDDIIEILLDGILLVF